MTSVVVAGLCRKSTRLLRCAGRGLVVCRIHTGTPRPAAPAPPRGSRGGAARRAGAAAWTSGALDPRGCPRRRSAALRPPPRPPAHALLSSHRQLTLGSKIPGAVSPRRPWLHACVCVDQRAGWGGCTLRSAHCRRLSRCDQKSCGSTQHTACEVGYGGPGQGRGGNRGQGSLER